MSDITQADVMMDHGSDDPFDDVIETGEFNDDQSNIEEDSGAGDSDPIEDKPDDSEAAGESVDEAPIDEEKPDEKEAEDDSEGKEEQAAKAEPKEEDPEPEPEADIESRLDQVTKGIEDGSLEIEIEGEQVSLKDMKNDFIGQKEISKRFSEIDVKNKQVEKDVTEINGYIDEFASRLKDGDAVGAFTYFGEFAGVPPYMIKEQIIAALTPEIVRRSQLGDTDLRNEFLNNQNEYLSQQQETENERRVSEQAESELNSSINKVRETHGIDQEIWDDTHKRLSESLEEGEQLTPELVADTVKFDKMYSRADEVINSLVDNLEDKQSWSERLVDVQEAYPDFTDEDLKETLKLALSNQKKEEVEEKLVKKAVAKKVVSKPKPAPEEELDPELEDWL